MLIDWTFTETEEGFAIMDGHDRICTIGIDGDRSADEAKDLAILIVASVNANVNARMTAKMRNQKATFHRHVTYTMLYPGRTELLAAKDWPEDKLGDPVIIPAGAGVTILEFEENENCTDHLVRLDKPVPSPGDGLRSSWWVNIDWLTLATEEVQA